MVLWKPNRARYGEISEYDAVKFIFFYVIMSRSFSYLEWTQS